jgi:hypothetical protein
MKTKQKLELMLNEQVTEAYRDWLTHRVGKLAWPSGKVRLSVLPQFLIQPRKNSPSERNRISG